MKKLLAIICSAAIIISLVAVGIAYFSKPSEEELVAAKGKLEETFYSDVDDKDTKLFTENMTESQMQQIIHAMSHQKVEAEYKWGKIVLTHPRVGILLNVLEKNKSSWEHSDVYADILNRWYEGDFSRADEDHNAIWDLQGGNIGEATGLLNAVEEQQYLADEE